MTLFMKDTLSRTGNLFLGSDCRVVAYTPFLHIGVNLFVECDVIFSDGTQMECHKL